jgi:hypothetical protein
MLPTPLAVLAVRLQAVRIALVLLPAGGLAALVQVLPLVLAVVAGLHLAANVASQTDTALPGRLAGIGGLLP